MSLKTWAPYDRLLAGDLNSAFSWSQDQTLPGAWSLNPGPDTASIASGAYGEVKLGPPPAGGDPLGYFQASTSRLLIPAGMGGMYQFAFVVNGSQAGALNDPMSLFLNIDGVRQSAIGGGPRYTGGTAIATSTTVVMILNPGQVLYVEVRMLVSSGVAAMRPWSLLRLGRGVGAAGAPPALYAGSLPAPEVPTPDEDEEAAA
jgi:hypothetical protein